jgi:hypothetical protein
MGAVIDPREEPLLIMEYMENGKSERQGTASVQNTSTFNAVHPTVVP